MEIMTEVDFTPFCETDPDCRYPALLKPFVIGGIRLATNSRMAVFQPTSEPDSLFPLGSVVPRLEKIYSEIVGVECENDWPETFPDCPSCGQAGEVSVFICQQCKGECYLTCDLGHDHDCDKCNCRGTTKTGTSQEARPCYDEDCPVSIGGQWFNRRFIQIIGNLPRPLKWGVNGEQLVFKTGDITGVILPIMEHHSAKK